MQRQELGAVVKKDDADDIPRSRFFHVQGLLASTFSSRIPLVSPVSLTVKSAQQPR